MNLLLLWELLGLDIGVALVKVEENLAKVLADHQLLDQALHKMILLLQVPRPQTVGDRFSLEGEVSQVNWSGPEFAFFQLLNHFFGLEPQRISSDQHGSPAAVLHGFESGLEALDVFDLVQPNALTFLPFFLLGILSLSQLEDDVLFVLLLGVKGVDEDLYSLAKVAEVVVGEVALQDVPVNVLELSLSVHLPALPLPDVVVFAALLVLGPPEAADPLEHAIL